MLLKNSNVLCVFKAVKKLSFEVRQCVFRITFSLYIQCNRSDRRALIYSGNVLFYGLIVFTIAVIFDITIDCCFPKNDKTKLFVC